MTNLPTVKQAAEVLHLSVATVYALVSQGKLGCTRPTGRRGKILIHISDINSLLQETRYNTVEQIKRGVT